MRSCNQVIKASDECLSDAFGENASLGVVTRLKSLTLTYRQRSGKRVTMRHSARIGDASLFGVVARERMCAHKDINLENDETRHRAGLR